MESNPNEKSDNAYDSHSSWIVKIGYAVLITIGVALVISLGMAFMGSYAHTANRHISTSPASDLVLDVVYPRALLFDDSSGSVVVSLTAVDSAAFTQPITVALVLPPSIVMSGTASNEWVFDEENGRYQQTAFFIQNTGILTGLIPPRQTETLTLTNALNTLPTTPSIEVETIASATFRQFMLGLLQDKSPLLLAIAALLPIAALVLQQLQRQKEREEQVTREEERSKTERKQLVLNLVPILRQQMSQANTLGIQQTWTQIDPLILQKEMPPHEKKWLSSLVLLSLSGTVSNDWQAELWDQWPDETTGALLAAQSHILQNPNLYRNLFRQAKLVKVKDLTIRNQFLQLWYKIEPIPLQDWTQEIPIKPNIIQESPLTQTKLHDMLNEEPFLHDRTENEEINLFTRDGFWFGHPAYSAVANAVQLQIVAGSIGCGRTALAKGLCYNESRWSRYFWHYRPVYSGLRDVSILRIDLVEQLLQYVITHPTLLLPLQEQQRHLLADVFVDSLPKQQVLALLEIALTKKPWLRYATKEQQAVWQDVGDTELALLHQAVDIGSQQPTSARITMGKDIVYKFSGVEFPGSTTSLGLRIWFVRSHRCTLACPARMAAVWTNHYFVRPRRCRHQYHWRS